MVMTAEAHRVSVESIEADGGGSHSCAKRSCQCKAGAGRTKCGDCRGFGHCNSHANGCHRRCTGGVPIQQLAVSAETLALVRMSGDGPSTDCTKTLCACRAGSSNFKCQGCNRKTLHCRNHSKGCHWGCGKRQ